MILREFKTRWYDFKVANILFVLAFFSAKYLAKGLIAVRSYYICFAELSCDKGFPKSLFVLNFVMIYSLQY